MKLTFRTAVLPAAVQGIAPKVHLASSLTCILARLVVPVLTIEVQGLSGPQLIKTVASCLECSDSAFIHSYSPYICDASFLSQTDIHAKKAFPGMLMYC